jgi:hypothetical protein
MKKFLILTMVFSLFLVEMQQVMNQFPQTDGTGLLNISGGLKKP